MVAASSEGSAHPAPSSTTEIHGQYKQKRRSGIMICLNSLLRRPATGEHLAFNKFGKDERRRKEVIRKQRVRLLEKES